MEKKSLLIVVAMIFLSQHSLANNNHLGFGFDNEQISETIPFTSYKNLIIIKAILDDKSKLNLILDTGIRSLVIFEKKSVPEVSKNTFSIGFTAAGEPKPISALVSAGHTLRLSDDVVANQINTVILKRFNPYLEKLKGVKIHGVFGYQLFSRFQVKIDYKKHQITLSEPSNRKQFENFEIVPIKIHDTRPFIETQFLTASKKWKKLNLLLDLGANHKVLLLDKRSITTLFNQTKEHNRIAEGLSSSIYGSKAQTKSLRLGQRHFPDIEFLIPDRDWYYHENLEIDKDGSIGGRLFEDSIIVVDYSNGLLYVEKSVPMTTKRNGHIAAK